MAPFFSDETARGHDESPFAALRQRMVERQLAARGIHEPRVLGAMQEVPRHLFVPVQQLDEAYEDWPLQIGAGQTISQPYTVAFMAQALMLNGDERVLEIGTGSGYGAAVLSRLAREVHTVERIPALASRAKETLGRLQINNVHVHDSDGTLGWPSAALFEAIVVTAGADQLPPPLVEQLAEGGCIIIPIDEHGTGQRLMRFTRTNGHLSSENLGRFAFVPLLGKYGKSVS